MNPLTPVLFKLASNVSSDGLITSYLHDQGQDVDLNNIPKPSFMDLVKSEIPKFVSSAATVASLPNKLMVGAGVSRLGGFLTGHPGAHFQNALGAKGDYAQDFNNLVGNPDNSWWKNILYRATSGSDNGELGGWGIGPALESLRRQYIG